MKLYVLQNGIIEMHPETLIADHPERFFGDQQTVPCPVPMYLIVHQDGIVLFDTGNEGMGHLNGPGMNIPEEQRLMNYLKQLNIKPEDVDCVVCSHLHIDHTGMLEKFTNATIIVHEDELSYAKQVWDEQKEDMLYPLERLEKWKEANLNWQPVRGSNTVLPFLKNLDLVVMGCGHSAGMLGLLVDLDQDGNKLIVSDAAYCRHNLQPQIELPSIAYDPDGYRNTLEWISDLAGKEKAEIWFGHE